MLIVLGIMLGLLAVAIVGVTPALRTGRLEQSATVVTDLCTDAMLKARFQYTQNVSDFHGVRFDGTTVPNRVQHIFGRPNAATTSVVSSKTLNANARIFQGANVLTTTSEVFFQPITGFPVNTVTNIPTAFCAGSITSGNHLSLRTLDQRFKYAIAIYEPGIIYVESF
jgi:hypothetical protein